MSDWSDDRPPPPEHRALGVALALLAAAALGFALVSHAWLVSADGGDLAVGLRSVVTCDTDGCTSAPLAAVGSAWGVASDAPSAAWPILGWVVSALLALACAGLLASAIAAATHRRPDWPVAPTTLALAPAMLGGLVGCLFAVLKPGDTQFLGASYGFFTFGGGTVCAVIGTFALVRPLRPRDPDLTADTLDPDDF